MAGKDSEKRISPAGQFEIVVTLSRVGEVVIDLSDFPEGINAAHIKWGDSESIIKRPTEKPASISPTAGFNLFYPGHVFKVEELPEGREHLVGATYIDDNPDGTMFILSAEQFGKDGGTWHELREIANDFFANGHDAHIATNVQLDKIFTSPFVELTGLKDNTAYWRDDHKLSAPDIAGVRFPKDVGEGSWFTYSENDRNVRFWSKKLTAYGRVIFNEPVFGPA